MKIIKVAKKRKDPSPLFSLTEGTDPVTHKKTPTKIKQKNILQNPTEHSGRKTVTMLKNRKNKIFLPQDFVLDH